MDVNPLAEAIQCTEDELIVSLVDGRKISAPLAWFPRLANASMEERNNWQLLGDGQGIHWPDIDEDLSVSGLLKGTQLDG
ncbi:MAG: DUF2442 domain-containing protein [Chromatiaceae bacterium]|nr:DUF2442 domain-containing protein [Chromatiaceae bacterium]